MPTLSIDQFDEQYGKRAWLSARELSLLESEGCSRMQTLISLLDVSSRFSNCGISGFSVGAIALTESGNAYFGANQEFEGVALKYTIHAEQAAIVNAFHHGEEGISALVVSAEPCGYCRQFLNEIGNEALPIVFENSGQVHEVKLSDLLPSSFGPEDLGIDIPFFKGELDLDIELKGSDELAIAALSAANVAYAPYSKAYSGVAIRVATGQMFRGSYLENAAFNPSISPMQSALVNLAFSEASITDIVEAVLVEASHKENMLGQRRESQLLLSEFTDVELRYIHTCLDD